MTSTKETDLVKFVIKVAESFTALSLRSEAAEVARHQFLAMPDDKTCNICRNEKLHWSHS